MEKKITKLSEIIPGARNLEPEVKNNLPNFLYKNTPKVYDLKSSIEDYPEFKKELIKTFKGKVAVDIGAGSFPDGMEIFAGLGASAYIGVEPYFYNDLETLLNDDKKTYSRYAKYKTYVSKLDMLKFMKSLPDNCPNIALLISGMDGFILGCSGLEIDEEEAERSVNYIVSFYDEVRRVLPKEGRIVNYASICPSKGFREVMKARAFESSVYILENVKES